jgi:hypothetical protein
MGTAGTSGWRRGHGRRRALGVALATALAAALLAAPAGAATDPGGISFAPGSTHLSSTVLNVISSQSGAGVRRRS